MEEDPRVGLRLRISGSDQAKARELGVDVDDLLIQSRRRDPMFRG